MDEGKVEREVIGDGNRPLDGALVGADHDALLPIRDVFLDPLAEEGLHLEREWKHLLYMEQFPPKNTGSK